jgi:N-carbamoyl-L-amino-acid hydrolase
LMSMLPKRRFGRPALRETETMNGIAGQYVSARRLMERQLHMDRLGATDKGGVHRLALSAEDNQARADLVAWARLRGYDVAVDPIGNLFITRPGLDPDAAPVMSGSHTDSQPHGGRFDGMFGVVGAFEALEALDDAGIQTRRPVTAVVWTGEEGGARFPIGTIGSSAFAGQRALSETLALTDAQGITLSTALEATFNALRDVPRCPLGRPVHAFLELHIEQGPVLEQAGFSIGVVTGIQGMRRFIVEITGEEAHSGTTPLASRKDALNDAIAIIGDLKGACADPSDIVRFTVGRFDVYPNAPAVVPGRVRFVIDLRHPDVAELDRLTDIIAERCRRHNGPCTVHLAELNRIEPRLLEPRMANLVEQAAQSLSIRAMRLISGANHDASHLSRLCPTGMIFIPCERGISHNEAENVRDEDLVAGARVLTEALCRLAQE